MQKWEYMAATLEANLDNPGVEEYMKKNWPDPYPPKYLPQALNPALNAFGDDGWELVHMEPVAGVGNNADILFAGDMRYYSRSYFCVFKRPMGESPR